MSPSKWQILYYFLVLRCSRIFRSNTIRGSLLRRWQKQLAKSAYYRDWMARKEAFPLMNKALFMEHFDAINTVGITKAQAFAVALASEETRDFTPMINGISVGLSSGTSGNKGIFLTSKREKTLWVAAVLDRVIGFSFKKRKVAFFLRANNNLYESVKSGLLAFTFFDLKIKIQDHFPALHALNSDILVAQPSVLFEIARWYQLQGFVPAFKKVISVAEVLESDQKTYLTSVFLCQIDQVYQCTEGFLAYTCKKGNLHFNEDWLKIEKKYLDSGQKRFHPVITDYLRSSQPVIRYELNDIVHEGSPCTCGSKATVIEKIEGRSDDVFRFLIQEKEVIIYPDFVRRAVITASDQILNYSVTKTAVDTLAVSLEIEPQADSRLVFSQVQAQIRKMLDQFGVTDMQINLVPHIPDPFHKFTRVKNASSPKL